MGYVFISIAIYLASLVVAAYAIIAVLRIKKEENEGRAELVLDKQVSRIRWMSSQIIVAALCSAALLLAMGIAGGLMRISPFSFAHYTIDFSSLPLLPLLCLVCISALLTGVGLRGFRNRDVLTKA